MPTIDTNVQTPTKTIAIVYTGLSIQIFSNKFTLCNFADNFARLFTLLRGMFTLPSIFWSKCKPSLVSFKFCSLFFGCKTLNSVCNINVSSLNGSDRLDLGGLFGFGKFFGQKFAAQISRQTCKSQKMFTLLLVGNAHVFISLTKTVSRSVLSILKNVLKVSINKNEKIHQIKPKFVPNVI